MRKRWMFVVPAAIVGIVVFTAIGGVVVRGLWNWLMPALFGLPALSFWQALALLALCRILFGRFGGRGFRGGFGRRRMAARWEAMTPEERERFRQRWSGKCGFGPSPETSTPAGSGA